MSSTTLSIKGMHCVGCAEAVEQALRDVPGVATVSVDLDHNTAVIEGGGASENLLSAVQAAGYVAEIVPDVQQNPSIV
jgi:Cu+-exporting ATPase